MLLKREAELAILAELVDASTSGGGKVVLVRGEAGIGKSALIECFLADSEDQAHILLGACDDLLTPQPLAPVWDMARAEEVLSAPLAARDPRAVMEAVLGHISRSLRPTILVFEDTQWADEATKPRLRRDLRVTENQNLDANVVFRLDTDHWLVGGCDTGGAWRTRQQTWS